MREFGDLRERKYLTTLRTFRAEILGSSSPLTKRGFPHLPAVVLSSSFRLITESCSRVPHGTIQNRKCWLLWYLLLEVFTCTSLPVQNPITSVFKVRCRLGYWVFKVVDYPFHFDQNTTKVPLEGGGFKPNFSVNPSLKSPSTSREPLMLCD